MTDDGRGRHALPSGPLTAAPERAPAPPTAPIRTGAALADRPALRTRRAAPDDDLEATVLAAGGPAPEADTPEADTPVAADGEPDADDEAPVAPCGTGVVLLVGGIVGAIASFVLLLERLALFEDPNYIPSCSVDAVLSCGTVMTSEQASLFGFPNPIIGLATFPVAAALGALLASRVALPRWIWWGLQLGTLAGVVFVHWLIAQSLLVINALCPYCMVAWAATIPMFWFVTVHALALGHLGGGPAPAGLARRHGWGLALWLALVVAAVVASFPDYFGALVGLG